MKGTMLYEGKAKKVYTILGEEYQRILEYKDDATAFNGKKHEVFRGKGRLNNVISSHIFQYLHQQGISSHFIDSLSETEQLVHHTCIIPIEVVVRNIATGSLTKRFGIEEGSAFDQPIVEFYYKKDELNDPLMNEEHAKLLTGVTDEDLTLLKQQAKAINAHLQQMFDEIGCTLVDFKLEFGRMHDGKIVLSDEISPDTCRLWDKETNQKMDKDVFRQGNGDLISVYETIWNRLKEDIHV
ncbi:phosphoribosylaminoimidazolesuccinocarboxamide synthase [Pontibacillus litoralis]|uniref:Phosphoribosylaminoimidazole-succinocarboxamide synthase n=1 Tax=Pontibacillus litoralis JSM 072002 TaxID=1385512 RepID=A0A0A5GAV7_9BACI|nr:phosphoribosylaminoimidazolesuccinocarboxamide synthase [Pontibacillus litoralis]KGX88250.1 phosphoribosylaminoimidazole-succinocarboxamide synthase [Pontibacillus litoralis JSM 072002]